jgi:chromosome segregation ATPase
METPERTPPISSIAEVRTVPVLPVEEQPAESQVRTSGGRPLKAEILAQIAQLQHTVSILNEEEGLKQQLEANKREILKQRHQLIERDRELKTYVETKLLLERQIGEQQEAWNKERERMVETHRHDLFQARSHFIMDLEKTKGQLVLEQQKSALLEQEKREMSVQYNIGTKELKAEIGTLKEVVRKLESDITSIGQAQQTVLSNVPSGELEEKLKQQELQLNSKDTRILQLESQVRELGAFNEELSIRLSKDSIDLSEEDEDLTLDPESVEPSTENIGIDQSSEPS